MPRTSCSNSSVTRAQWIVKRRLAERQDSLNGRTTRSFPQQEILAPLGLTKGELSMSQRKMLAVWYTKRPPLIQDGQTGIATATGVGQLPVRVIRQGSGRPASIESAFFEGGMWLSTTPSVRCPNALSWIMVFNDAPSYQLPCSFLPARCFRRRSSHVVAAGLQGNLIGATRRRSPPRSRHRVLRLLQA